uniref:CSON006963 protein n=1 Tax=Culicoides sonorensis TaxID=179676 RepID=A0A336MTC6_CULSO
MKTKTIKKSGFPLYEEGFNVPYTLNEQDLDDAIVLLNVNVHTLCCKKILGQCSVTLKDLKDSSGKQIMRNLTKVKNNNDKSFIKFLLCEAY